MEGAVGPPPSAPPWGAHPSGNPTWGLCQVWDNPKVPLLPQTCNVDTVEAIISAEWLDTGKPYSLTVNCTPHAALINHWDTRAFLHTGIGSLWACDWVYCAPSCASAVPQLHCKFGRFVQEGHNLTYQVIYGSPVHVGVHNEVEPHLAGYLASAGRPVSCYCKYHSIMVIIMLIILVLSKLATWGGACESNTTFRSYPWGTPAQSTECGGPGPRHPSRPYPGSPASARRPSNTPAASPQPALC